LRQILWKQNPLNLHIFLIGLFDLIRAQIKLFV